MPSSTERIWKKQQWPQFGLHLFLDSYSKTGERCLLIAANLTAADKCIDLIHSGVTELYALVILYEYIS